MIMSSPSDVTDLIKKAEKCLKISLLKRTCDYDGAIEYYGKAALIYRNRKQIKEAAETYKKVAELHFKNGSYFHCAKQYEVAAQMYRDLKDYSQMATLIAEAGLMLRQNGTPDSASYVYERAAKSLEEPLPERAAEFYERSADACEIEEKFHEAASQANNAARLWVRLKRFNEAERLLRLFIDYTTRGHVDSVGATVGGFSDPSAAPKLCGRAVTVLILIKLYMEDEVAARKIFNEAVERWRFPEAEEFSAVRRLLAAVDDMDKQACLVAMKDQCFRMLDLDYARLAKEIKFPYSDNTEQTQKACGDLVPSSMNTGKPNNETGGGHHNDEEEQEEDIC
ncbi:hypothetical protein MN116_007804 [Schistosoma mekongi]|uniref:Gamma-soluble NSF attachment protein n=1 Tax=Schistosoma mekongi TaxID=38744 RepID=A0AAE1Z830_SCHME|nr:hypothetical protein MN116_007804 [Schistosoma mekongi]